ncbi:MAG: sulfite exporter TauE/SafE family protein [Clostridia bacterium]|nr:sulfite exporter TauE/SafE family protein [Oscillospiraceae bacterium]MBQ7960716.1 sulfite exporter TauE/SafE family protein [Clostridia bacterium]
MLNIVTGFFSGIISGMGIGGGAILIPALIMLEELSQQTAQGINLTYFIPTAIISLFVHMKNKNVEIKTAAIIGSCGVVGSLAGSLIAVFASSGLLRRMFGIFLLFVGIYEIYKGYTQKNNS